jgi:DNA-directed RNA polymerase subunit RPC12/RpoP
MNETFYFCENCKEFFEGKEILIENGGLHCPHCGGPVQQAEAHVDYRGKQKPETVIYKYPLPTKNGFFVDDFEIQIPMAAQILTVQLQKDRPRIGAMIETDAPLTAREFCIRGTGHAFKGNEGKYIGTFQVRDGDLVFHLFEGRKK